jgi:two-component sensor histidine kinase
MGDLIDDLLAFSHLGRSEMQKTKINFDELVRKTLGEFEAETRERNIMWKIHALPVVQADQALLRLVLVNLISNAVKFTGGRTEATIEIGCVPNESAETVIFIRDNGAGFDPNYTKKLFGVFQRLHNQNEFEGTGIGLANVQRIIRRHGGRVWAEGAVDVGATFYFSIPKTKLNWCGSRGVLGASGAKKGSPRGQGFAVGSRHESPRLTRRKKYGSSRLFTARIVGDEESNRAARRDGSSAATECKQPLIRKVVQISIRIRRLSPFAR